MALSPDHACAFTQWLETYGKALYNEDRHSGDDAFSLAWAAFEEGIRVASRTEEIRYDAQYRRRFLGGARLVERDRRESITPQARSA